MVGPARSVNGGISTVVNNYYNAGLDEKIELQYIGTMEDGSKRHKLKVAVIALLKFVKEVRHYEIVHINMASDSSLYRKIPFIYLTKLFRKKLIIHQHGGNFQEFYYSQCGEIKRKFIKKTLEKADVFMVVAAYLRDIFKEIITEEKLIVLSNAIEVPKEFKDKHTGNKLLFLGRLCKEKGIRELLEAVSELKEEGQAVELYLGGVWVETELKEMADKYKDFIYQLGWLGKEDKEKYLRECNIFVLPTYFEGLPMSLLEGMAYECACVASAVGGIPQVIDHNRNGILIKPKEKESLKEAIRCLLSDIELQKKLGKAGRQKVVQEFELYHNMEKLMNVYRQLSDDKGE